ncbi:dolichyl-phosphate beta-glucosyltransferase-like isoform X2 [Cynara cardunculus var. scolymus]|uniref:dolichyl-phosphate beta-glucosyltransferase-like isoform X2 n=1 Tax=Cynara cardunculus var. scolymus TaxID=59895 RepID=UPI000D6284B5|nr:dolichyl-phosphate beta-glucosyltransferase-like isoform X2 [Cynara cardunculus var. scolymus]
MELWGWRWTMMFELVVIVTLVIGFGLVVAIAVETFRRRFNHAHLEAHPIFEDPNSFEQVQCPYINDPAEKYISLIIPAYNEEYRLPAALDEALNYLQQRSKKDESFSYEIIIIDDGSSDRTKRIAFDFVRKNKVDNVRVILQRKNQGKGEAIRKGMLHSRGELLLMLDADGATKVDDLEKLENQRKWYRNFLMKGFHVIVLLAAGRGVRDTQCGFKMFSRAAARKLFTNIRLKRWCFDVELVYLCKYFHIPILEISVNWSEIPGSKVNPLSILNMLWELALMSLGYRTGIWNISS